MISLQELRIVRGRRSWSIVLPGHEEQEGRGACWRAARKRDCEAMLAYARDPSDEALAAVHATTVAELVKDGATPWRAHTALVLSRDPHSGTHCPTWLACVLTPEQSSHAGKLWRKLSDAYLAAHEKALADAEVEGVREAAERAEREAEAAVARRIEGAAMLERNARLGVDRQLAETREHGEIDVRQAESTAMGSELVWRDHPLAVRWDAWVLSLLTELTDKHRSQFPGVLADACDSASPNHVKHLDVILLLWKRACKRATELPALLDLSGFPSQHGWLAFGATCLTDLIKRCSQGATILVPHPVQSWALARTLPPKVGAR